MFGLRKYKSASKAFKYCSGDYSEYNCEPNEAIFIGNIQEFRKKVVRKIIDYMIITHDTPFVVEEGRFLLTDAFVNFNFMVYHKGYFYCGLMTMKDDGNTVFDEEEWSVFEELDYLVDFFSCYKLASEAISKVKKECEIPDEKELTEEEKKCIYEEMGNTFHCGCEPFMIFEKEETIYKV